MRAVKKMTQKKIKFKEGKPFYDIVKRRKQSREYFIKWMQDNADVIVCDETIDVKKMSFIQFKYVPHGRRAKGEITKGEIYERLAILFQGLGMANGFEYGAESFFRYISSNEHSNLATDPKVLKREIMRYIQYDRDKKKLVGINCNSK